MTTYTTRYVRVAESAGGRSTPRLSRMKIRLKLALILGTLAALTLIVVILSDLASARWATLAAGLAAVLLALASFFFLLNTIEGPIRRLTRVAEQVRAGDLEARAVVESQDEIGLLAETFNRMTRNLRRTLFQTRRTATVSLR